MDINNRNDDILHHRTNRKSSTIHTPSGDMQIDHIVITEYLSDGSAETTEHIQSRIESGENIFHISAIKGQCVLCHDYLTIWTMFRCFVCRVVICPKCSKRWEETKPVCPECHKELKKKKRWKMFWNILISPFVTKIEEE